MLQSPNEKNRMMAMFQFGGLVSEAADKGAPVIGDAAIPFTVLCCGVRKQVRLTKSPLSMSCDPGDQFVTLDQPFVINMGESEYIQRDRPGGVAVIFCWKYTLGGEQGVTLDRSGLCLMQCVDTSCHFTNLLTVASVMKSKMSRFSAKIACMQAAAASASSSSSAVELSDMQGVVVKTAK